MTADAPYPPGRAQARCGTCHQPIRWVTTETGSLMPLDPHPTDDGNVVPLGPPDKYGDPVAHVLHKDETPPDGTPRFVSHFTSCPHAKQHRRRA